MGPAENEMIRRGPFKKVDKAAAWCLAAVFTIGGAIGMGLAVAKTHWRLGFSAAGTFAIGALWAVAATRGRPLEWPFLRRTKRPEMRKDSAHKASQPIAGKPGSG